MKNNREKRVESAKQTLQILEDKKYQIDSQIVDITQEVNYSISSSEVFTSEELDELIVKIEKDLANENRNTAIVVENCTCMKAAENLIGNGKTGCLNFASAKNPGGGFLSGAQAQEESLARASALYPTQMKFYDEMYSYNRNRTTYLYSDRMIYSPATCFFKRDDDTFLSKPYTMDVLTSPAVNVGAMHQNKRLNELPMVEETMLKRIDKILSLFYINKVNNVILGAWGCGVFRNEPKDVAGYFARFLQDGGKYAKCFDRVIFAVYDTGKKLENISAFEKVFND